MDAYSSKTFKVHTFSEKELLDESKNKMEEKWKWMQRPISAKMLRIISLKYDICTAFVGLKESWQKRGRKIQDTNVRERSVRWHLLSNTATGNVNLKQLCLLALSLHKIGQANDQLWTGKGWCGHTTYWWNYWQLMYLGRGIGVAFTFVPTGEPTRLYNIRSNSDSHRCP